ncbi:hypothetical protein GCM10009668_25230 [Nocardioides dubius]|uniref:Sensor domain-containing protein n=1 Tax=Nocardioides dubius TaxID=317019 RepID=A0ABN1TYI4_9ACTN
MGIAAASMLVLTGAMGTAQAAPATVTNKNLPTMAEVVKAVPQLKGGVASKEKSRTYDGPGKKCTGSKKTKADAGRMAVYMPDFEAEVMQDTFVMVHTLKFANKAKAKAIIADVKRYAKRCSGKVYDGAKSSKLTLPKIGDERAGLAMHMKGEGPEMRANLVVTRKGRTLVQVIQMGGDKPAKSQTVAVAKVALKRSR